ncbi:antirestriction protein ArdA [Paraburkholderia sp. BL21I4N1]|uniref:antirestriction protein ArdA n=1 Tax=Paraburkholderia sp. BL21I4N1 TaxID=1938801 RepID=UPI000CFCCDCD|nr:antirestriction protein ArdA [Paraburkholderia sp. BL21I4N1]PQV53351.1 antirestriction protein ArdA [Paraburkholderia sp. BL21I4N1]
MTTNQPTSTNGHNETAQFLAPQAPTTAGMTTGDYFAQPYNTMAAGFYFSDYEEYTAKAEALRDPFGSPVEEFEIQAIDLDRAQSELFEALKIDQSTLERWFDEVVDLDEREMAAVFFLVDNSGYDLDSAMDKKDDVSLHHGDLLDAATELFDECYGSSIPDNLKSYIDYEAFARDCRCGDMVEFDFGGTTYTCTSANHC